MFEVLRDMLHGRKCIRCSSAADRENELQSPPIEFAHNVTQLRDHIISAIKKGSYNTTSTLLLAANIFSLSSLFLSIFHLILIPFVVTYPVIVLPLLHILREQTRRKGSVIIFDARAGNIICLSRAEPPKDPYWCNFPPENREKIVWIAESLRACVRSNGWMGEWSLNRIPWFFAPISTHAWHGQRIHPYG